MKNHFLVKVSKIQCQIKLKRQITDKEKTELDNL
jgi:hypothetical protein